MLEAITSLVSLMTWQNAIGRELDLGEDSSRHLKGTRYWTLMDVENPMNPDNAIVKLSNDQGQVEIMEMQMLLAICKPTVKQ